MTTPITGAGIGGAGQVGGADPLAWHRRELGLDPDAPSFADTLKDAIEDVSRMQDDARDIIGAFVRGEHVELHEVMAATEEAGIALDLLIEIRNKLTDAYRAVMNMQS